MNLTSAKGGVLIALEQLRSNKVRASLTILGIVIGVATVMTMAAAISGFQGSIMESLNAIGPKNFFVDRFDQTQVRMVSNGSQRQPWEGKPPMTFRDAEMLEQLPTVQTVATFTGAGGTVKYRSRSVPSVNLQGFSPDWPDYTQGDFVEGRNFTNAEFERSANVAVITPQLAETLFQGVSAVGKEIRIRGQLFRVVGVFREQENIFSAGQSSRAYVPTTTAIKRLDADPDWMQLLVVPAAGATQEEAMDEVMARMRQLRGLRPGEENNFALMRQEALADMVNGVIGVFAIVMLVLAGVGLIVGGVGVVGIMMISVTERTREIGVRKALGATPREILWQFLVESMTVTLIGGIIGLSIASAFAFLIKAFTPIPAAIPLWAVGASLLAAAVSGMGFGLYPAFKAARLDPVDALRYE
ncbi:ABC transporter permease [Longimicrobium sp.]|uniref:ABC transporter permease n=1 Tax=Longimicrobium sp. TaxID=2029185 RepID=UPI002E33249C|nr:ABC transporter permease [Longimicrobium sp.]HEX6036730.1 ABC transporter permease [Longimicrobium sp.]